MYSCMLKQNEKKRKINKRKKNEDRLEQFGLNTTLIKRVTHRLGKKKTKRGKSK